MNRIAPSSHVSATVKASHGTGTRAASSNSKHACCLNALKTSHSLKHVPLDVASSGLLNPSLPVVVTGLHIIRFCGSYESSSFRSYAEHFRTSGVTPSWHSCTENEVFGDAKVDREAVHTRQHAVDEPVGGENRCKNTPLNSVIHKNRIQRTSLHAFQPHFRIYPVVNKLSSY